MDQWIKQLINQRVKFNTKNKLVINLSSISTVCWTIKICLFCESSSFETVFFLMFKYKILNLNYFKYAKNILCLNITFKYLKLTHFSSV